MFYLYLENPKKGAKKTQGKNCSNLKLRNQIYRETKKSSIKLMANAKEAEVKFSRQILKPKVM